MSLSPTCTISGGATPAAVANSATISGALATPAGAAFWSIQAIGVDDATGQAGLVAIKASLSVNQTAKTFTFTSPSSLGSCVIFQSTVGVSLNSTPGSGRDANGNIVAAWTTTFKVNVLTANGFGVVAPNEIGEQDPVYGWTVPVNAAIRAAGTGGGGGTSGQFNITLATGVNHDVATGGLLVGLIGGPTGAFSIGGIASTAATKTGLPLVLINTTAFQMTILHEDSAESTDANRIRCLTGNAGSLVLKPFGGSATLYYDASVSQRWYVTNRGWETQSPTTVDTREIGLVADTGTLCTDNWPVYQNAVDGATGVFELTTVYIGNGGSYFSRPIFHSPAAQCQSFTHRGARSNRGSGAGAQNAGNPFFQQTASPSTLAGQLTKPWLGPQFALTCFADPTFSQVGNIYVYTVPSTGNGLGITCTLNLQETGQGCILGDTQFDMSLWHDPAAGPTSNGQTVPVWASYGQNQAYGNVTAAQLLVINQSGTPVLRTYFHTTTNNGAFTTALSSTPYPANTLTHTSVSYDGTTVRTFQDISGTMTVVSSMAMTGAIVQREIEDFCLGYRAQRWPMTDVVDQAQPGARTGSVRLCDQAQHTTSYATPTVESAVVTDHTHALINFGPTRRSNASAANGGTQTSSNPSGHQGYIVSLWNKTKEMGLWSNPLPGWLPWHGTTDLGRVYDVTFDTLNLNSIGTGIYSQACQRLRVLNCQIDGTRCLTWQEYSYQTLVDNTKFNSIGTSITGGNTSHSWCIGAFSEIAHVLGCYGGGGTWNIVQSTFNLHLERCYFDSSGNGNLYAVNPYNITSISSHWYNEFSPALQCNVYLEGAHSALFTGGAVTLIVNPYIPYYQIVGPQGVGRNSQSTGVIRLESTTSGGSYYAVTGLGTGRADPVIYTGWEPFISPLDNPTTNTLQWTNPVASTTSGTLLTGTFKVTQGSPTIVTSVSQVGKVSPGDVVRSSVQPGVSYTVASGGVTSSTITLTANFTGYTPGAGFIGTLTDLNTTVTSTLVTGGPVPMVMPHLEGNLFVFDLTGLSTYTVPVNCFYYGRWKFINGSTCTITIPINQRGKRVSIQNQCSGNLTFAGPDGGTVVVAPGVEAIGCSEFWIGTGTITGTWEQVA